MLHQKKKPRVFVTRRLPDAVETRMRELFDTELNVDDLPKTQPELVAAMKTYDVLVPTVTDRLDAAVISQAGEQLKLIANFGTGVDNIDVDAAARRGITVTNTPNVLSEDTADMTMALILAVPRRLTEGARVLTDGDEWRGWSPTWMLGRRIWGKRLGIVGMGRIGTAVARRARAFGLSIHYHNRHRVNAETEEALEATYWDSLDQMLARMDIISVNCPSTPATFHLLSARRLALMKPGSYIVNTSRGGIIDEKALIKCLRDGAIAGAGLDVFEHEPSVDPKLVRLAAEGKVVLLPHMGSATIEGRIDMGEKVIVNIRTFFDGHRPPDRVLPGGSRRRSTAICPKRHLAPFREQRLAHFDGGRSIEAGMRGLSGPARTPTPRKCDGCRSVERASEAAARRSRLIGHMPPPARGGAARCRGHGDRDARRACRHRGSPARSCRRRSPRASAPSRAANAVFLPGFLPERGRRQPESRGRRVDQRRHVPESVEDQRQKFVPLREAGADALDARWPQPSSSGAR